MVYSVKGGFRAMEVEVDQRRDGSALIADKLLQGWALLNAHCPRCYTPLVRNKQSEMFCVTCDDWVYHRPPEAASKKCRNEDSVDGERSPKRLAADNMRSNFNDSEIKMEITNVRQNTILTLVQKLEGTRARIAALSDPCLLKQELEVLFLLLQCLDSLSKMPSSLP